MFNFLKENIWLVVFAITAVFVVGIEIIDKKKNLFINIKSKALMIFIALIYLSFSILLILFDFDVI